MSTTRVFGSFDGTQIAYLDVGEGPAVLDAEFAPAIVGFLDEVEETSR